MSQGTVLIVDNNPQHIVSRRIQLEQEGYEVIEAHRATDATTAVDTGGVHLAVVDVRLKDDNDPNDFSGIDWINSVHQLYPELPCLVLTSHTTVEAIRRALGPQASGLPPAEDFISKTEEDSLGKLVAAVGRTFKTKIRANFDLDIQFEGPVSCLSIAELLERKSPDRPDRAQREILLDRADECETLLRRMYSAYNRIVIRLLPGGRSGCAVLAVQPYGSIVVSQSVAKLGPRAVIAVEQDAHAKWALPLNNAWVPVLRSYVVARHFGGIVYSPAAGSLAGTLRFRDFFRLAGQAQDITRILDEVFDTLTKGWYTPALETGTQTLPEALRYELGLTPDHHAAADFASAVKEMCAPLPANDDVVLTQDGDKLRLALAEKPITLPNPQAYVYGDKAGKRRVRTCIIHGDFNGDNLLVDQQRNLIWLIDFARTGRGPALRDFAELECAIKFELITESSISQLAKFEKSLVMWEDLHTALDSETLASLPPDLQRAAVVVAHLRSLVSPAFTLAEYFTTLLFESAWRVITGGGSTPSLGIVRPEQCRKVHALLSAAMLCQRLDELAKKQGEMQG
jgi:CheY-like chemotaxis protein